MTSEEPSTYRALAAPVVGPVYPVSEVTRYLRELLEHDRHLSGIWVSGEVSNLNLASSGHAYFTLKDERGALRCAFFRNRNAGQRQRLENGASYLVFGALSLYEPRGELSFVVEFVQPEGVGALQAEFERRRARFEEEGLFALERKRALPRFPERVGVVTSPTGAVFHDIQTVLDRRWPLATLLLQPTVVQGPEAAPMIADSIRLLDRDQKPEVIIVARGGGSWEELWPFNEEPVVRAIHGARAPVVSAVGHETDTTLADLAADVRAATPSAAAELVSPDRVEVERDVDARVASAGLALTRRASRANEGIERARVRLVRGLPNVAQARDRVAALTDRALRGTAAIRARREERIEGNLDRLRALSPLATLERGYAVVQRENGAAVTSAQALIEGERVALRFRDGTRGARVEGPPEGQP
jgi:exodeoxyribonuclease VII large subunit